MGKTHSAAGALTVAALGPPIGNLMGMDIGPGDVIIGALIGTIAGVLPDIDHPSSLITQGLIPGQKKLGFLGTILGWFLSIPPRIIGVGARSVTNHRGGTHSILFGLCWAILAVPIYAVLFAVTAFVIGPIIGVLFSILDSLLGTHLSYSPGEVISWIFHNVPSVMPMMMLFVFLGYMAHLVTDGLTRAPVPYLWPFVKKGFFLLPKSLRIKTDGSFENNIVRPVTYLLLIAVLIMNVVLPIANDALNSTKSSNTKAASVIYEKSG